MDNNTHNLQWWIAQNRQNRRYQTWHLYKSINPINYGWYFILECMDICKISFLSQSWATTHARRSEAQAQIVNGRIKAVGLEPKPPSSVGLLLLTYSGLLTVPWIIYSEIWIDIPWFILLLMNVTFAAIGIPALFQIFTYSASQKKVLSETRKITHFTKFRAGCYIGVSLNWVKLLNHLHLFLKCSYSSRIQ